MFKVKCKGCNTKIMSLSKVCPSCGMEKPTEGRFSLFDACVIGVMLFGAVKVQGVVVDWWHNRGDDSEHAALRAEADCKRQLQCWGDKNKVASKNACIRAIEGVAKYSVKWTADELRRFPQFRWTSQDNYAITYVGDAVQFQIKSGAYQNMRYECDYDAGTDKVLSVRIEPGHMNAG